MAFVNDVTFDELMHNPAAYAEWCQALHALLDTELEALLVEGIDAEFSFMVDCHEGEKPPEVRVGVTRRIRME